MSEIKHKVAYFDCDEVWLHYVDDDGEHLEDIEWPDDWPETVTTEFLIEQGFRIER